MKRNEVRQRESRVGGEGGGRRKVSDKRDEGEAEDVCAGRIKYLSHC